MNKPTTSVWIIILFAGLLSMAVAHIIVVTSGKELVLFCMYWCKCVKLNNVRKVGILVDVLGGVMVTVLAIGPKVRGFKPDRGQ
jgi:hypothetical protein